MKKKNILSTGEFARLCKTTKETLFHYDRINLLRPKHVSENGYRYYGVEQFFDFDIITTLKETGSSLREIMVYMQDTDAENFLALLTEKLCIVSDERKKLAQREMMLRDMAAGTREALDFAYDTFTVAEQAEERLEALPTNGQIEDSPADFIERYSGYMDFYNKQKRTPRRPFGAIWDKDDVISGQYVDRYYFSRATRFTPRSLLHVKPQGRYAVMAHNGTIQTHMRAVGTLLKQIEAAGLTLVGNFYYYDLMSHVLIGFGEKFAAKYCVRVESGQGVQRKI